MDAPAVSLTFDGLVIREADPLTIRREERSLVDSAAGDLYRFERVEGADEELRFADERLDPPGKDTGCSR